MKTAHDSRGCSRGRGRPRVLVADDDRSLAGLYKRELEDEGYEVLSAYDGPETIHKAEAEKPDVVVLDLHMPGMNGLEVMSRILEHDREIPVIVNSAYVSYKESFLSWLADAYLTKCGDLTELKGTIHDLLERKPPRSSPDLA
jgi:DNA-binding response OmpR family regulator